jgi:hypothetical protein
VSREWSVGVTCVNKVRQNLRAVLLLSDELVHPCSPWKLLPFRPPISQQVADGPGTGSACRDRPLGESFATRAASRHRSRSSSSTVSGCCR